jgi:PelA/Pel-15E family pectate lyase
VVIRNCRFLGWQDTMLLNRGRQYIEDSFIAGHVDFIFGGATVFFERCQLHIWRDGYITAASTPADAAFGFVFANGTITGAAGAKTYLGRPWRDFAQVTFLKTQMSDVVRPEGWHNWDKPERERTSRYSEFASTGPGARPADRVAWAKPITRAEAEAITAQRVLAGSDNWNPAAVEAHPSSVKAIGGPLPAAPGTPSSAPQANVAWDQILRQPAAWYATADAERIADNVLAYQRHTGGWPKNLDMAQPIPTADRAKLVADRALDDSTIDNGSTVTQLRLLARVFTANEKDRFKSAFLAGYDYLLAAQYANGGWPQYFPLRSDYSRHITFNDDAMMNVMTLLRDASTGAVSMAFVDAARRTKAADAVQRGIAIVLRTQIRVNGRLTGWCQQHDAQTLVPVKARAYEHPSIASKETVTIVRFLMGIDRPNQEVVQAIDGAVEWLRSAELHGIRLDRKADPAGPSGYDMVVVDDPAAPPIWARFYDITTNRPIYSGRDGVIKSRLADIEIERRTGYSWLGPYATALLATEYPQWKSKIGRSISASIAAHRA